MGFSLIVNADDFGIARGVNASIIACHRAGSLTSASFMANMAEAEEAANLAAENAELGIGLHFNLTSGQPVAPVSNVRSLVGLNGFFLSRQTLLSRVVTGRIAPAHLQIELEAQLQRMRAFGMEPTHFDSHQHVHAIPMVFDVLAGMAAATKKPMRIPWRWKGNAPGKSLRRRVSERVLQLMVSRCIGRMPADVVTNTGLCSVFDLNRDASELSQSSYVELLSAYNVGIVELMVHPGLVDEELAAHSEITRVSEVEDKLLRSDFLRQYVVSRGGAMVSYRDAR